MTIDPPLRASSVALVVAVAAALMITGCSRPDKPASSSSTTGEATPTAAQRRHIRLYAVEPSTFHDTIETTGVVDFDNDQATTVLAPFSGPVSRLLVSPGQRVAKGEALALVESSDFSAAVGAYRKAVATAQTARRLADLDKDLLQHQGVSGREAEQAQTDAVNAEADRAAASQALVSMSVDAQTLRQIQQGRPISSVEGVIRSPIAGIVVDRPITPGQLLQAGVTPCFTVADLSRVWVMAQIFTSDLASVDVGDTARVTAGDGAYVGRVENVGAQVDPATGAVAARVAVENPAGRLKKQMYVRAAIEGRRSRAGLLAPASAILRDDENLPFVYLAQPDGGFARRRVTLGQRVGGDYDIAEGLRPGDRVVIDGAIFVQFMQDQ